MLAMRDPVLQSGSPLPVLVLYAPLPTSPWLNSLMSHHMMTAVKVPVGQWMAMRTLLHCCPVSRPFRRPNIPVPPAVRRRPTALMRGASIPRISRLSTMLPLVIWTAARLMCAMTVPNGDPQHQRHLLLLSFLCLPRSFKIYRPRVCQLNWCFSRAVSSI